MSDLSPLEKRCFERLFGMPTGFVMNFGNGTFADFVLDTVHLDIYAEKYNQASGSKAHRLRAFWTKEPNHVVARLLRELLGVYPDHQLMVGKQVDHELAKQAERIVARLEQASAVAAADALAPTGADEDFDHVAREVQTAISSNRPEAGLDRLHTFVTKFARGLCEKHGLPTGRELPLHNLFGSYTKHLKAKGHLESRMGEQILRSSIGILDAFNDVRNNKSLAHDNQILGYDESLLIFSNIAASVRFVKAVELRLDAKAKGSQSSPPPASVFDDDIPF